MELKSDRQTLLKTKFFRPKLTSDHVKRTSLISRLNVGSNKQLILVSAPSGYGKSTLISDWIGHFHLKSSWLSLSEYDDDLILFIRYFIESIRFSIPGFGEAIIQMLQAPEKPTNDFFCKITANELSLLDDHFYLTVDDYHFIHDPEIHAFVQELLRFPIPYFHLIIITRRDSKFIITEQKTLLLK